MVTAELLSDARNYLDVTWEDMEGDLKLTGILERGMAYLDRAAGGPQDYVEEGLPRALLFDYARYARNNALEYFEQNFRGELIALRMGVQADDYAAGQGYI